MQDSNLQSRAPKARAVPSWANTGYLAEADGFEPPMTCFRDRGLTACRHLNIWSPHVESDHARTLMRRPLSTGNYGDIWLRRKGSNLHSLGSKPSDLPFVHISIWLRGRDLNPRPSGYEPDELPDCSTPRYWHRC